jgi:sensor histidine kinase YesM
MAWYSLETFAFSAMLLLVILIQCHVSALPGIWPKILTALGTLVCFAALIFPRVMGSSLELMLAYSHMLATYSWVCALFLVISASYAAYKNTFHSPIMLLAAMVFAASLVMYRLLPVFEPIRFGLFSEIAGAVFVILIGVVMANEVAGQFKMRNVFERRVENVSRMMEMQKAYYTVMFEKDDAIKKARHDIRHHILVIRELIAKGGPEQYSENLLGALSDLTDETKSYCSNHSVNAVAAHYLRLAENEGIAVDAKLNIPEDTGAVPAMDLCVILGNFLENALEACRRVAETSERFISVRTRIIDGSLVIIVENSFDGVLNEKDGVYLSLKEGAGGDEGIGLSSVKAVCDKHEGMMSVETDGNVWKASAVVDMGQIG